MTNRDAIAHYRTVASDGYAAYTEGRLDVEKASAELRRHPGLDVLRGVAVLFMVVDHVAIVMEWGNLVRNSAGRVALPLFFVVAGMCVRRLPPQRAWLLVCIGLVLPWLVRWVDNPNVLVLYVVGCGVVLLARRVQAPVWLFVVVALTVAANGFDLEVAVPGWVAFQPLALIALMCLGAEIGSRRIPRWRQPVLQWIGRHSLGLYVGHVLALEALRRWVL